MCRKQLTDWLLWKLGNFRFTRFADEKRDIQGRDPDDLGDDAAAIAAETEGMHHSDSPTAGMALDTMPSTTDLDENSPHAL